MANGRGTIEDFLRRAGPPRDLVEDWKALALAKLSPAVPTIRLRIGLGFVLLGFLIGIPRGALGAISALSVIASIVLVQELPRAWLARSLGRSVEIQLSPSGGSTHASGEPLRGIAGFAFVTVGSLANLAVAGALWSLSFPATEHSFVRGLALCHAIWGFAQILPVVPFRAGVALARRMSPQLRFAHATLPFSLATVLFLPVTFTTRWLPAIAFLGLLVAASLRALREAYDATCDLNRRLHDDARLAELEVNEGSPAAAITRVRRALSVARSAELRARLWSSLAWAAIGVRDPFLTHGALQQLAPSKVDVHLLAAYLSVCNRRDEAISLLAAARARGHNAPQTNKLLVDLLFQRGDLDRVRVLALSPETELSREDRDAVLAALGTAVA